MLNNLLRKSLTLGIIILVFGICFTNLSTSFSINESNFTTNDNDILYFLTARLIWNDDNIEYKYSDDFNYGDSWIGPLELLTYYYGLIINCSFLLLNGTMNVKPQNAPSLTLHPGDKISMAMLFYYGIGDDYGHSLIIGRAFDIAIEKA